MVSAQVALACRIRFSSMACSSARRRAVSAGSGRYARTGPLDQAEPAERREHVAEVAAGMTLAPAAARRGRLGSTAKGERSSCAGQRHMP